MMPSDQRELAVSLTNQNDRRTSSTRAGRFKTIDSQSLLGAGTDCAFAPIARATGPVTDRTLAVDAAAGVGIRRAGTAECEQGTDTQSGNDSGEKRNAFHGKVSFNCV
jgi:hypothetical protein